MSIDTENRRFLSSLGLPEEVFARPTVLIDLSEVQAQKPWAPAAFALACNLLARMFHKVHVTAPAFALLEHPWHLKRLEDFYGELDHITPGSIDRSVPAHPDIVLGIGGPSTVRARKATFVDFNGWAAGLDIHLEEAGDSSAPLGALLAACYGAAQVFLHAVDSPLHRPMRPFRFSLLDFTQTEHTATILGGDLGEAHLVGVGAVGSAALYALRHVKGLRGVLHAIDDDVVAGRNLHRYVLMRARDIDRPKTLVAEDAFLGSDLTISPHPVVFDQYIQDEAPSLDLLLTPVDSEASRRRLARSLPRRVLNAATGGSTVTISRHAFADGMACLACLYPVESQDFSPEAVMARDLGVEVSEVTNLLESNRPVDEAFVRRVEVHRGDKAGALQQHVGERVQSFYQQGICGNAPVTTASGTVISPLSFISATAGVFLAGELVKTGAGLRGYELDNYFRMDTLAPPNPDVLTRRTQESSGKCICWDKDYLETYRNRFPT